MGAAAWRGAWRLLPPIFSRNDFIIIRRPIEYEVCNFECLRLQSLGHKNNNSLS